MIRTRATIVRRWLWLASACVFLGSSIAFAVSLMSPVVYSSEVGLLVAPPLSASGMTLNDVLLGQALTPTFAQLAVARPTLAGAIASSGVTLSPDALAKDVTTSVPTSSNLLYVTVRYDTPDGAARLANAIGAELVDYAHTQTTTSSATGSQAISVSIVEPAVPPASHSSRSHLSTTIIGAAIGLFLAGALAYVFERLRTGVFTTGSA